MDVSGGPSYRSVMRLLLSGSTPSHGKAGYSAVIELTTHGSLCRDMAGVE